MHCYWGEPCELHTNSICVNCIYIVDVWYVVPLHIHSTVLRPCVVFYTASLHAKNVRHRTHMHNKCDYHLPSLNQQMLAELSSKLARQKEPAETAELVTT